MALKMNKNKDCQEQETSKIQPLAEPSSAGQSSNSSKAQATKKRSQLKKDKRKSRIQKNNQQKLFLQQEFERNPTWSNSQCKQIADQTGLSVSQVYKWGWDKKNRLAAQRQHSQYDEALHGMVHP